MALKYRFNLKDIKLEDFKVYLVAMFKGILPKKKIKNIDDLPENAKNYIKEVENFIETKISSISTSPERDDTILIENPFEI